MTMKAVILTGAVSDIIPACTRNFLWTGISIAAANIIKISAGLVAAGDCLPLSFGVYSANACNNTAANTVNCFGGVGAVINFAIIHHTKT